MYEVIPGILEKDWGEIERKINLVKSFTKTESNSAAAIHIDIIDGKFAPNTTFLDPAPFAKYAKDLLFEVHLMVEEPINYLESFADAGFKRLIAHVEKMSDQVEFVAQAQRLGEVGLAIDAPTSIDAINVPLADLDFVTIMTVKAGLSGQEFIKECLKKVKMLKPRQTRLKQVQHDMKIEVDGGINDKTIVEASKAGATRFVATSFVFGSQDPQKQYELLTSCVGKVGS